MLAAANHPLSAIHPQPSRARKQPGSSRRLLKNSCHSESDPISDMRGFRYMGDVKSISSFFAVCCATLLSGCSVQIDATQAVARIASAKEVQGEPEASSSHPEGIGVWVTVGALIAREDVDRVARWEVYPHVYIVECSTGRQTNIGTEPTVEGIQFADANSMRKLLKSYSTKQTFEMQSLIFARGGDFKTPQCLQFRGGSYTGQKVVQARIPIRANGQLP